MATKLDCTCEPEYSKLDYGNSKPVGLRYNPRCPFHKGPDAGYGYDTWGQPNGKYSVRIGAIIGGGVVAVCIGTILFLIVLAFIKW